MFGDRPLVLAQALDLILSPTLDLEPAEGDLSLCQTAGRRAGGCDYGGVQEWLGRAGGEGRWGMVGHGLTTAQEPDDEIIKSGVSPDNIRKWKVLQSVQDRNETLFYR